MLRVFGVLSGGISWLIVSDHNLFAVMLVLVVRLSMDWSRHVNHDSGSGSVICANFF